MTARGQQGSVPDTTGTGPHPGAGITVREARGDDLENIRALGLQVFPATYAGIIEPELIQLLLAKWWTKEALVPAIRTGRAFVAHDDEGLVGMCSVGPDDGSYVLWKLYVLPRGQGRGVGSALLAAATARAEQAGLPLRISFTDGNRPAREFCRHHGYLEVGREEQVGMPELVWMARPTEETSTSPAQEGEEDR